ncbi:MAG: KEOPS complex N(6)-L-threonylcarbamoyladenine synthase Kae1 [Candidatus Aenigmatarchaeota archaeon]
MISLGIESTAHTLGIGIVNEKEILADVRDTLKTERGKGYLPREMFNHHLEKFNELLFKALDEAKIDLKDIDVIGFSRGMGIPNALRVGAFFARYISLTFNKPLVDVNHGVAHIEIGKWLTNSKDPIIVYLSGGNTQIISLVNKRYRILGETEDIAIGNAIDEVARFLNFEMPGGPKIEELAKKGKKYIEMPYSVKGMNLSFSGIVTYVKKLVKEGKYDLEDIIFSFQETIFSMIVEVSERAMAMLEKNEVLLVGGVAANKRLQEMFEIMCKDRNAELKVVPQKYAADNGVMIAINALLAYKHGYSINIENSSIKRNWRIDEVEIIWI